MKKFTTALTFIVSLSLCLIAQAGPEPISNKDKVMQLSPGCEFYRAHEWDFSIWGTYAFSGNPGRNNVPNDDPFSPDLDPELQTDSMVGTTITVEPQSLNPNERVDLGRESKDTFLGRDDSWGAGMDVKYFWSRYFGVGVEGFVVDTVAGSAGSGLVTFTARYPIGHFAPYVWGGAGVLAGGGRVDHFYEENHTYSGGFVVDENEHWSNAVIANKHAYFNGQLGIGVEYRLTCRIGIMADFAWNFVAGQDDSDKVGFIVTPGGTNYSGGKPITFDNNVAPNLIPGESAKDKDFGLLRFGLTFSY
ncbi:MAG: hypothetical protein ABI925_01615 [Verrucomicrobiota bacterium]